MTSATSASRNWMSSGSSPGTTRERSRSRSRSRRPAFDRIAPLAAARWNRPARGERIRRPIGPSVVGGRAGGRAMGDDAEAQPSAAPPAVADGGGGKDIPGWVGKLIWRSLWQLVAVVLITLAALRFVYLAQDLVRWLILSVLLSFALEPAVIYLHEKRGWRRGAATGLILFAAFLLMAFFGLFMAASLARGASGIAKSIPAWIDSLNQWTQQHLHVTAVSSDSTSQSSQAAQNVNNYLQEHAGDVLGAVGSAVGAIFSVFTVGMFTFYLTANGDKVRRAVLSRMPPDRQARVLWTWEEAIKKTGGYLYSRGGLAAINGGLLFIPLLIVGTPSAGVIAVFEGIGAEFLPIAGPS